ncbi:eukaryotic translation initiation factor 2-alpha kinase 3-like isoform X2 [Amphiprion ocellaris]|uniref:eukaryotic translation initiation factor 2-alpha kinase 3-like isoform X2 n=1 Tax=Amphiprion ocellaris TaxID=80972 RepID=UPI002411930B|nr:eukaryotic translation initiation factor 2-alpha kinase 3-like isoform X2 [Amphiprion ocellaris]
MNAWMRVSAAGKESELWRRAIFLRVIMKAAIDGQEFPIGVGRNENEAKQNAAKSALRSLNDKENRRPVAKNMSKNPAAPLRQRNIATKLECEKACVGKMTEVSDKLSRLQINPDLCDAESEIMDITEETNPGNGPSEMTSTCSEKISTKYFIWQDCLGRGGYGQVYQVKHKLLNQPFAVKIVPFNEKALREAKAISDLNHPHIVRCFSVWVEDSGYPWDSTYDSSSSSQSTSDSSGKLLYIQMEPCDRKTLREWIDDMNERRSQGDSERREKSLTIAQQIFSAVEYIHSKKLIHRDLKPSNIMFGQDGKVKIGDFGLVTDETDDSGELMKRTVNKGTPNYMAPEQEANKPYDRKVDIFPLGLIYFELLWKISTYHERNGIWKHIRERKLPKEFAHRFTEEHLIIMPLLSVEPQDRPEASKVKMDLEEFSRKLISQKTERRDSRTM